MRKGKNAYKQLRLLYNIYVLGIIYGCTFCVQLVVSGYVSGKEEQQKVIRDVTMLTKNRIASAHHVSVPFMSNRYTMQ